ncbi:MAG TPA: class I SAM-dependent methyltransferase [Candidatus Binatia bacterium]
MSVAGTILLLPGRDKSLRRRHPWIFSGAIAEEPRSAGLGDTVDVVSFDGEFLARAAWSPHSSIRARVWSFDESEPIDSAFFRRRVERALERRDAAGRRLNRDPSHEASQDLPEDLRQRSDNAMRVVHGESDGLPGLIVDFYAGVAVCQFLAAGAERWRREITEAVGERTHATSIYERSDADVRDKEGLEPRSGLLAGREPDELVEIGEAGRRYLVDVREGHKTGFYLDQRPARDAAGAWCRGREVLNAFSYTGGFSVAALAGGAAGVLDVDTSAPALALALRNVAANDADATESGRYQQVEGDVFSVLRRMRDSRRSFGAIILDPPKFADSRAHLDKAARGYKDINLLAFKLLAPGGVLMTFSCSGLLAPDLFQKIVADAAVDARREAAIVARLSQGPDHPVALAFPEGAYLKGLVCVAA